MILSMTGFAAVAADLPGVSLAVELRSVNHRYLDLQLRLPDELRGLESALRERIAAELKRGKVECRVTLNRTAAGAQSLAVDTARVEQLAAAAAAVHAARARRDAAVDRRDPALARRAGRTLGAARGARGARPRARRPRARRPRRLAPARRREDRGDAGRALRRHRGAGRPGRAADSGAARRLSSTSSAPGCAKPGSIPTRTG